MDEPQEETRDIEIYDRLIDHVNREIGVAGETALHERVSKLEEQVAILVANSLSKS